MATETFQPDRLLLSMQGSSGVYHDHLAAIITALPALPLAEAEDLVATAGEDERAYAARSRPDFVAALVLLADEFMLDDEGGYYRMMVHLTRYARSPAAVEIWFHVSRPGSEGGGTWIRRMAVGLSDGAIYTDMGAA